MSPKKEPLKPPQRPHFNRIPSPNTTGPGKRAPTPGGQHSSLLSENTHAPYLSTYNDRTPSGLAMQKNVLENEMGLHGLQEETPNPGQQPASCRRPCLATPQSQLETTVKDGNMHQTFKLKGDAKDLAKVSALSTQPGRSSRTPLPSGRPFIAAARSKSPPSPPTRHPTSRMWATVASSGFRPLPTSNEHQQHGKFYPSASFILCLKS
jgi:hypothetical protein